MTVGENEGRTSHQMMLAGYVSVQFLVLANVKMKCLGDILT